MTDKLYYSDSYTTFFRTRIMSVTEDKGRFFVVLPETYFFPEGGGQPCDKGYIDGIKVLDVFEKDNIIYHILPSLPENKEVDCKIDFARRFDHMQQHSGEHLLASVFYNNFDAQNLGFHLGEDYVSIDLSLNSVPESMLKQAEDIANEIIYKNLEIKTYLINPEDVGKIPLRKAPQVTESIRVVEIDNSDYSPCCGTHVSRTGEIGIIKIIKSEKYKDMTRVYFKCGKRALSDYQNKHGIVSNLYGLFSTSENKILDRIESDISKMKSMSAEIKDLKENLFKLEAAGLVKSATSRLITADYGNKSFSDLELMAKLILQLGEYIVILSSIPENRLLAICNGDNNLSMGKLFKENLPKFSGKGGGSEKQAQAAFSAQKDLADFKEFLVTHLKESFSI